MPTPIRVAIANDYDVVVAGVAACLAPFPERVRVVELVTGQPADGACDVVLYDTFGQHQGDGIDLEKASSPEAAARVLVFSWNDDAELVESALSRGAAGYVSKRATAEQLVDAIERVHSGVQVRVAAPALSGDGTTGATPTSAALVGGERSELGRWPGLEAGLTARESEVLALICQGLSNQEIAERAYLGVNTVKTYVRGAYRKIGVTSRSQAVLWGVSHGFAPDHDRELRG